jgi:hypothetical protein
VDTPILRTGLESSAGGRTVPFIGLSLGLADTDLKSSMEPADVTVAIVVPWIHRLRGHRVAVNLARELSGRGAHVDFFIGRIFEGTLPQVSQGLGDARLHVGKTIGSGETSMLKFARYEYSRSLDSEMARTIASYHRRTPYTFILVISNDGHWIGEYLRKYLPAPRPLVALCVRELPEHVFWLGYDRRWSFARTLLSPVYPIIHAVEVQRIRQFDMILSISPWTSALMDYFYGILASPSLMAVDRSFFEAPLASGGSSYVAVPTASLDAQRTRLVQRVAQVYPHLRTFGRNPVPGIPHAGYLGDAELVSFLANASATLFVFDYEALGLIPLESLAAGTPVVTLPKQGTHSVLAGNPHVRFGETPDELRSSLEELSGLSSDPNWRAGCRSSVIDFRPDRAVDRLLTDLSARTDLGSRLAPLRQRTSAT